MLAGRASHHQRVELEDVSRWDEDAFLVTPFWSHSTADSVSAFSDEMPGMKAEIWGESS